jgi:hypothetical protein
VEAEAHDARLMTARIEAFEGLFMTASNLRLPPRQRERGSAAATEAEQPFAALYSRRGSADAVRGLKPSVLPSIAHYLNLATAPSVEPRGFEEQPIKEPPRNTADMVQLNRRRSQGRSAYQDMLQDSHRASPRRNNPNTI